MLARSSGNPGTAALPAARRFRGRRATMALLIVLACSLALSAAQPPAATQPKVAATQPAGGTAEQLEFARRPISYFNQSCANCHGDYGSFWGEGFAADLKGGRLREVVREMAAGPAFAPLEEWALEVQTAYHRSLVDGKPFVTVYVDKSGNLAGEVTPGSTVFLVIDNRQVKAMVAGHTWSSSVREASAVNVTKGQGRTELNLADLEKVGLLSSHGSR